MFKLLDPVEHVMCLTDAAAVSQERILERDGHEVGSDHGRTDSDGPQRGQEHTATNAHELLRGREMLHKDVCHGYCSAGPRVALGVGVPEVYPPPASVDSSTPIRDLPE